MSTIGSAEFATLSTQATISPEGVVPMATARGEFAGETVQVASDAEKLADASEELGMSVAHRADRKTLQQREVRQGRAANVEALARITEYLDKLPDMPKEAKLKSLVDQLQSYMDRNREGGDAPTKEDVFAALRGFDADASHQFAALEIAVEYFAGLDASLDAALEEAKLEFERDDLAREVRAGFAVAALAHEAAQTLATDPAAVRETYRRMLRERRHMGQLFDELLAFDDLKKFDEIVALFLEAAGRDLGSAGPSTDPRFLELILTELGKLKRLNTVHANSGRSLDELKKRIDSPEIKRLGAETMTSRLLHFCSTPAPSTADAMGVFEGLLDLPAALQIQFGNTIKSLYDLVPDEVLPAANARDLQIGALLGWMTHLAEREEAEFASR